MAKLNETQDEGKLWIDIHSYRQSREAETEIETEGEKANWQDKMTSR